MLTFSSLDQLRDLTGTALPYGEWVQINQSRVDLFADVTEDHEWLHVDLERAKAGPYGGTIAHGFLTLSLVPMLGHRVYRFDLPGQLVNYGLDSVRFPGAVPTGSRLRSRITPVAIEEHARGHRIRLHHEIEVEGQDRLGCVADTIFFLLPAAETVS